MRMIYLFALPGSVPEGMALVHNRVTRGITPSRKPGSQGFRAWLSPKGTKGLEPCDCGWAPQLAKHYKLKAKA